MTATQPDSLQALPAVVPLVNVVLRDHLTPAHVRISAHTSEGGLDLGSVHFDGLIVSATSVDALLAVANSFREAARRLQALQIAHQREAS